MTFEDLEAWSEARRVVNNVYAICRDSSVARDFGLCDQIRRAAVSIMTNIAEGFERIHLAEKLQFYNIARARPGETRSFLTSSKTTTRAWRTRPSISVPI